MNKIIFLAVIAFVVAAIALNNNFTSIHHGEASFVYDASSIDETVAQKVHQHLIDENAYAGKSGEVLMLKKTQEGVWVVKFPVYQGGDVPSKLLQELEIMSLNLQKAVLNNEPLEVHITNAGYQSVQFFRV